MTVKRNLLRAGLFPGCSEGCLFCAVSLSGCPLLKLGVQSLMDSKEILFKKFAVQLIPVKEVSVVTIFNNPIKTLLEACSNHDCCTCGYYCSGASPLRI